MTDYPKQDLLADLRKFSINFPGRDPVMVHDSLLQVHSGFYQACREASAEVTLNAAEVDPEALETIHDWIDAS
jgi:hypothetical protein